MIKVIVLVASLFINDMPVGMGVSALDKDGKSFTETSCEAAATALIAVYEASKPPGGIYDVGCMEVEVNPKAGSI